jgi:hypothetical protein
MSVSGSGAFSACGADDGKAHAIQQWNFGDTRYSSMK